MDFSIGDRRHACLRDNALTTRNASLFQDFKITCMSVRNTIRGPKPRRIS